MRVAYGAGGGGCPRELKGSLGLGRVPGRWGDLWGWGEGAFTWGWGVTVGPGSPHVALAPQACHVEGGSAGLVPSQLLEEKRKAFVKRDGEVAPSSGTDPPRSGPQWRHGPGDEGTGCHLLRASTAGPQGDVPILMVLSLWRVLAPRVMSLSRWHCPHGGSQPPGCPHPSDTVPVAGPQHPKVMSPSQWHCPCGRSPTP